MNNSNQKIGTMKVEATSNKNAQANMKKNKITFSNLSKDQKETLLSVGLGAGIIAASTGVALYSIGGDGKDYIKETSEPTDTENLSNEELSDIAEEVLDTENSDVELEIIEDHVNFDHVDDFGDASEVVTLYTDAPWAYLPEDDMEFSEAFEMARTDVGGGGGFFHWNGNIYNTYSAEEWEEMTDGEREQYYESIEHLTDVSNIPDGTFEASENNMNDVDASAVASEDDITEHEYTIGKEDILSSIDYENDGINDGYIVDVNNNGFYDIVVDLDGNGQIDELILDLETIRTEEVNAIQVNGLPTDFEVTEGYVFPSENLEANEISITEDDVIESANITGNSDIDAVLVDLDGDDISDIGFDSDADGAIDVVVVDLGTPTQEIIEIDAVAITPRMEQVEVDNDGLDDFGDENLEALDTDEGFDLEGDDLDADADFGDDIDYSDFS